MKNIYLYGVTLLRVNKSLPVVQTDVDEIYSHTKKKRAIDRLPIVFVSLEIANSQLAILTNFLLTDITLRLRFTTET